MSSRVVPLFALSSRSAFSQFFERRVRAVRPHLVPSFIFTTISLPPPSSFANRGIATVSGRPRGIPNRLSLLCQSGQGGCGISFARDASGVLCSIRLPGRGEPPHRAARRSVSSFLIDSARQSRLSDLLGRSTRWFRRDGRWARAENRGGWKGGGFLLGVAERGRDSVGGRCGLIVIGKALRVFQLFPDPVHTCARAGHA